MGLSSDLISQFVRITNDDNKPSNETTVYGTTVEYNGHMYVKLDGSELLTPVATTADMKPNERVTVMIKNHTATVTGNMSSPAARTDDLKEVDGKVEKVGNKISEFEIVMAYKVSTDELEAAKATIDSLKAKIAKITDLDVVNADIENLQAKFAELNYVDADEIKAITANIDSLQAKFGEFTDVSTEDLEALNADIETLRAYTADFTYVSAEILEAFKANIKHLEAEKLSVKDADLKYANIDFTNISKAAIEYFYSTSGLIKDVTIGDGTITGELVGVTIRGDRIVGNTIQADKLVIKGEDGLYYKLNFEAGTFKDSETVPTDSLHGSVITAKSITAEKVSVKDLVAFGATIGGFTITDKSLYSGVKASVDNTTKGIYFDSNGQIAIGDSDNYFKYYTDSDGNTHLEISANSISIGTKRKSVEKIAEDAEDAVKVVDELKEKADSGEFKGEDATTLRIDSSRGTVFKNSAVSTVLSAVIYKGSKRITDITALKAEYGDSAYLEWSWQRMGENAFGTIVSTDSRIGNGGFTFTLSPDDVDTKVVFMCQLITD
jgi:hypothetical protein